MAGRYVILEFEDRDAANAFVQNNHVPHHLGFKIVAMFLKPKKFCECPERKTKGITKTGRVHQDNWRKHPKYGLYVCRECGRPSQFHNRGILQRLQYAFGYSILGKS